MARRSGKLRLGAAALVAGIALVLAAAWARREASASSPTPLLPDLVADAPDGQELVSSSSPGGPPRLLLRFNGYIHNAGPGALDIRATREAPQVQGKTPRELAQEIQIYKGREETLPPALEAELAEPAMNVSQRLFTTNAGNSNAGSTYLERPHVEQPSEAQMLYVSADGHHHWHLQRIVSYSLWNAARTSEVAPSQKVGFCLEDVEHVESGVGPLGAVYAPSEIHFCRQFEPNATSVQEGISPGWRDVYDRSLAFQWVDVSDVAPGEYWLREDIDPSGVVREEAGGPKSRYAQTPSIVPGFVAEPQSVDADEGQPVSLTLAAQSYADAAQPSFTIVSGPAHGTISELGDGHVEYVPEAGFSGSDSFAFTARDPGSPFPEHPPAAAVQIAVASHRPALSISGAQSQIDAGATLPLSVTVSNDTGGIEWSASSGGVTAEGDGRNSIYTAPVAVPPSGEEVTITARLADDTAVADTVTLRVDPAPPVEPAPEPPPETPETPAGTPSPPGGGETGGSGAHTSGGGSAGGGASSGANSGVSGSETARPRAAVSRPRAILFGRALVMTTVPTVAGRVRLAARVGRRTLGACAAATPPGRTFTCRVVLPRGVSPRAHISVVASLRAGRALVKAALPARRIPEMKMNAAASAAASALFWCEARRPRRG